MVHGSPWTEFFSMDWAGISKLMKVTKGKGTFFSPKWSTKLSPNWSRKFLSPHQKDSTRWLHAWHLWKKKQNILIQTFLFYRKSDPTTLSSAVQKIQKKKKKAKKPPTASQSWWCLPSGYLPGLVSRQPVRRVDSSKSPWTSLASWLLPDILNFETEFIS